MQRFNEIQLGVKVRFRVSLWIKMHARIRWDENIGFCTARGQAAGDNCTYTPWTQNHDFSSTRKLHVSSAIQCLSYIDEHSLVNLYSKLSVALRILKKFFSELKLTNTYRRRTMSQGCWFSHDLSRHDVCVSLDWYEQVENLPTWRLEGIQYKLGIAVHRRLQNKAPHYRMKCCTRTSDVSSRPRLRSAKRRQLMVPRHRRSRFGRRAFSVVGPMEWNSLPHSLRDHGRCTDSCRSALKTHLFAAAHRDD